MLASAEGAGKRVDAAGLAETGARIERLHAALAEESARLSRHEAAAASDAASVNARLETADKRLADADARLGQLGATVGAESGRLDRAVAALQEQEARATRNEAATAAASATAREALERAIAAGRLAEGKLLYETVLSETMATFERGEVVLSGSGKAALTAFADKLRAENRNVFIEIQGYTDSVGSDAYNLRLGRERALAARDFLHQSCGLALHRMAVMSYGESRALADNTTAEGRAQNRRVVLVVLR